MIELQHLLLVSFMNLIVVLHPGTGGWGRTLLLFVKNKLLLTCYLIIN